jgi:hypothetical protein
MVTARGGVQAEADRAFARDVGIEAARLIQTDMQNLRLRYVPAVVMIDATGTVLWSREGVLTETERSEILGITDALPLQQ